MFIYLQSFASFSSCHYLCFSVSVPPSLCNMGISRHMWLLWIYANQTGYCVSIAITYLPYCLSRLKTNTHTHTHTHMCTHTYKCMSMLVSKNRCPWSLEEVTITPGAGGMGVCEQHNINAGKQTLVFCKSNKYS